MDDVLPKNADVEWDSVGVFYDLVYGCIYICPQQRGNPERVEKAACNIYLPVVEREVFDFKGSGDEMDKFADSIERKFSLALIREAKKHPALDGRIFRFYQAGEDAPYMTSDDL